MKKNRSVMEDRAPAEVIADTAQRKRWRELDYFASPPWSVRAGLEVIRHPYIDDCFGGLGTVWEPACGDGVMAKVLADDLGGTNVVASDIEPQGYGQQHDFLCDQPIGGVRWIVTNPPFANAADFVNRGLGIAKVGVAILCRLAFLESSARFSLHARHLTDVAIFSERVPMQLGPWNPDCSTATAYAWFFFSRDGMRHPAWGSTGAARLHLIPPGTKARLTKPDDVRRFCKPSAGSLL